MGDIGSAFKDAALEILADELKRNNQVLDTQLFAVVLRNRLQTFVCFAEGYFINKDKTKLPRTACSAKTLPGELHAVAAIRLPPCPDSLYALKALLSCSLCNNNVRDVMQLT